MSPFILISYESGELGFLKSFNRYHSEEWHENICFDLMSALSRTIYLQYICIWGNSQNSSLALSSTYQSATGHHQSISWLSPINFSGVFSFTQPLSEKHLPQWDNPLPTVKQNSYFQALVQSLPPPLYIFCKQNTTWGQKKSKLKHYSVYASFCYCKSVPPRKH